MAQQPKHAGLFLLLAIFLLSLNLRPAIAAIGPLIQSISQHAGIKSVGISLLTTIPVLMMGLCAIYATYIRQALGERNGIAMGAAMIAAACLLRLWGENAYKLFGSAVLVGLGIAVIQALLPGFIKRNFGAKTSSVIALYSTGIVVGVTIGSGTASWLEDRLGWMSALAGWSIPAAVAVFVWLLASRNSLYERRSSFTATATRGAPFWRIARCWSLLLFFGVGTGAFMLAMAWISPFYIGLSVTKGEAGILLSVLTVVQALTALWLSFSIDRFPDRRSLLVVSLLLVAFGFLLLIIAPLAAPYFAVSLLGGGIGILFPLSIIVAMDHLKSPTLAGNFTAFVQGGGFIIASLVPLTAGSLRDAFNDLSSIWLLMVIASLGMLVLAVRFSPKSYVQFQQDLADVQSEERQAA
ncbi:MFS transporter [Verminephrobacter aporrectodeae subsp. tuberculatae]|uniref:MFS transporter n=1 Tax=Verminephrobacter aporrectodeae TaxID=1110389 RepID=UPI002238535B|nr:MFS transporter [Verminephrobacter aporrectodeae]MCW5255270.1 MFS transporter [Verminephrobacter aporrectodeae subsp. tuberculatae]